MQAMIFAAGLGTRLKPLTDTMPKALVKIGGEPLLKRVILRLRAAGFTRVVVNVHHFADMIIDYLSANNNFGLDIRISDERNGLLDTGGGIKKALPFFDSSQPVLIHNVDILSNVDLRDFYESHQDYDATLLVSSRDTKRYLLFEQNESRLLLGWTNIETNEIKTPLASLNINDCSRFAFSGIHLLSPRLFDAFSGMPDKFGIIDFYLKCCDRYRIQGYVKADLRLMDVGKIDTLDQAETFITLLHQ